MPGRQQIPSFKLPSGTTAERDGSYNLTTVGNIFYNTDTSNVEIRHEDPINNIAWRDFMVNNKEVIDISGKLIVKDDVSFNGRINIDSAIALIPQIALFNFHKNESDTGNWGNNSYFDSLANNNTATKTIGATFCSHSNGIITLNRPGLYKISVGCNCENVSFNNRVTVGTYVSINNNTVNWRNPIHPGKWGVTYLRDDNHGVGGNMFYSDYYPLTVANTQIRIKTQLGHSNNHNLNYSQTLNDAILNLYCFMEIQLISTDSSLLI